MALTGTPSRFAWVRALPSFPLARLLVLVATLAPAAAGCTSAESAFDTAPSQVTAASATPAVAGTWTGTYRVVECAQHGGGPLANMCAALGSSYPFTLELHQQGPVVTGRYALANVWFDLRAGQISNDRVTLQGAGRIDSAEVAVEVTWSLSVAPPALGGTALLEWTADAGGGATLHATLVGQTTQ